MLPRPGSLSLARKSFATPDPLGGVERHLGTTGSTVNFGGTCWEAALFFFALSSVLLAVVLLALIVGAAGCGLLVGRSLRESRESVSESFGVLQAALLGFMGLILAFGLSLAVGRYETRRAEVVNDAKRHRDHVLARADPARTSAQPVADADRALYRRRAASVSCRARQRCRHPDDRCGIGAAAAVVEPRRAGGRVARGNFTPGLPRNGA